MNKNEFLEILQDYLKKYFSQSEVDDILRDYEEYFVEGIIEGKSEEEIIKSLGSPKAIVRQLAEEIDVKNEESIQKKDIIQDKLNVAKLKAKDSFKKTKEKVNNVLTPSLTEEKGLSNKVIKVLLGVLTVILSILAIIFIFTMIGVGVTIATISIGTITLGGFTISTFSLDTSVGFMFTFLTIGLIGLNILLWQVYLLVINLGKTFFKMYRSWIKKRNLYIKAKDRINENKDGEKYE